MPRATQQCAWLPHAAGDPERSFRRNGHSWAGIPGYVKDQRCRHLKAMDFFYRHISSNPLGSNGQACGRMHKILSHGTIIRSSDHPLPIGTKLRTPNRTRMACEDGSMLTIDCPEASRAIRGGGDYLLSIGTERGA